MFSVYILSQSHVLESSMHKSHTVDPLNILYHSLEFLMVEHIRREFFERIFEHNALHSTRTIQKEC